MTMYYEVEVSQLGIENDPTTFYGDTPGEVVEQVIDYLRAEHHIAMPDADVILGDALNELTVATPNSGAGAPITGTIAGRATTMDPGAVVIVRRLRETLDLPRR